MFQNYTLPQAAAASTMIAIASVSAGVLTYYLHASYCDKHSDNVEKKHKIQAGILRFIMLATFSITGLCIGNLICIGTTYCTAISHGMVSNENIISDEPLSYGRILFLNKNSIKETDIDINDLKNKAIIYVRYDCPDCISLHNQLAEIDDMIFLSSRTETGKAVRELYDINLTEIPQGVYIDADGKATVIQITQGSGDELILDLHQINILREMVT